MATRAVAAVIAATLLCMAMATSSEWVDYPSGLRCCSDFVVYQCNPESSVSNAACRDVCHYGGCRRGGQCEYMGLAVGRGCHCNC